MFCTKYRHCNKFERERKANVGKVIKKSDCMEYFLMNKILPHKQKKMQTKGNELIRGNQNLKRPRKRN